MHPMTPPDHTHTHILRPCSVKDSALIVLLSSYETKYHSSHLDTLIREKDKARIMSTLFKVKLLALVGQLY